MSQQAQSALHPSDAWQWSESTRNIITHLIEVICPPDVTVLRIIDDIAAHVAAMMNVISPMLRQAMIAGLVTYDLGALVAYPLRGKRAHQLKNEQALAYFDSWAQGPTILHRQLAKALMQLITLAYYEQPSVQQSIGYTPAEWINTVTKRRLATYQGKISVAEQQILAPEPLRPGVDIKQQLATTTGGQSW